MIPDQALLDSQLLRTVGWVLLHCLWQGSVLAIVTGAALMCVPRATPELRYGFLCGALALLLAAPVVTAVTLISSETPVSGADGAGGLLNAAGTPELDRAAVRALPEVAAASWTITDHLAPYLAAIWLLGVLVAAARRAGGCWLLYRLQRQGWSAGTAWQTRLRQLSERVGLRHPVQLLLSARVESPAVIGWLRPVVLMPVSALSARPTPWP
jgi:bla regulator protein blaR1